MYKERMSTTKGETETRFFLGRKNQRTFRLRGAGGIVQTELVQFRLQLILSLLT